MPASQGPGWSREMASADGLRVRLRRGEGQPRPGRAEQEYRGVPGGVEHSGTFWTRLFLIDELESAVPPENPIRTLIHHGVGASALVRLARWSAHAVGVPLTRSAEPSRAKPQVKRYPTRTDELDDFRDALGFREVGEGSTREVKHCTGLVDIGILEVDQKRTPRRGLHLPLPSG